MQPGPRLSHDLHGADRSAGAVANLDVVGGHRRGADGQFAHGALGSEDRPVVPIPLPLEGRTPAHSLDGETERIRWPLRTVARGGPRISGPFGTGGTVCIIKGP